IVEFDRGAAPNRHTQEIVPVPDGTAVYDQKARTSTNSILHIELRCKNSQQQQYSDQRTCGLGPLKNRTHHLTFPHGVSFGSALHLAWAPFSALARLAEL